MRKNNFILLINQLIKNWKNKILNQYCAFKAAIKYDLGKLAKDINHWQYFEKSKDLIHKKKNIHLTYLQMNLNDLKIALTEE